MAQKKTKKKAAVKKTAKKVAAKKTAKKAVKKSSAPKTTKVSKKAAAPPKAKLQRPAKLQPPAPKKEVKQTKKEALKASGPVKTDAKKEKEIKKAKKALGKAKQNLAKARVKDFGSKLGKNLISQGAEELAKKWESLFKRADSIESKPYRMRDSFEERTAIEHKVLGWGFVLSNQNDRLEVLFRDGIRYLISNYKP